MRRVLVPLLSPDRAAAAAIPRAGAAVHWLEGETMGTTWRVGVVAPPGPGLSELREQVQGCLDEIVAQMSTWEAGSCLSRYNAAPAGSWTALPEEMLLVLSYAREVAQASGVLSIRLQARWSISGGLGPARRSGVATAAVANLRPFRRRHKFSCCCSRPAGKGSRLTWCGGLPSSREGCDWTCLLSPRALVSTRFAGC